MASRQRHGQVVTMELKPIYRFRWDGREELTSNIPDPQRVLGAAGVEVLAEIGEEDPECEVELVGYEQ